MNAHELKAAIKTHPAVQSKDGRFGLMNISDALTDLYALDERQKRNFRRLITAMVRDDSGCPRPVHVAPGLGVSRSHFQTQIEHRMLCVYELYDLEFIGLDGSAHRKCEPTWLWQEVEKPPEPERIAGLPFVVRMCIAHTNDEPPMERWWRGGGR